MSFKILDNGVTKFLTSETYNMVFRRFKKVGTMMIPDGELLRWGKEVKDDPDFCPYGPEITDIEISSGRCQGTNCPWCYKNNGPDKPLSNMSLETYKKVFDKINVGPLGQVALGLTNVKDNPDLLDIMRYTLSYGCFPNFTISGSDPTLDYEMAENLAELCGALAVSITPSNYEDALDKIKLFTSLGVGQTNAHVVVSDQSVDFVHKVLDARMNDPRLRDMGAIVGLMIKPKGRAKGKFKPPTQEQYEGLVHKAFKNEIPVGFDSCSARRFEAAIDTSDLTDQHKSILKMNSDPCESLCFSIYVNVKALVYSCSFCEGQPGYEPINLLEAEDFVKDVWMSPIAQQFRKNLIERDRSCPAFPEIDACLGG